MQWLGRRTAAWIGVALAGSAGVAAAQTQGAAPGQTVTVVAGEQYGAGGLHARFFGEDYRDLWTTPIQVPVLDLRTHAGGLTPVERGGGLQTRVLHLRSAAGRDYVFRSVDKNPSLAREPALQGTLIADVIEDQVSSLNPAAASVVAPLLEAVGVLHVTPQLVVMPDDPALGEFREEFAGVLGWIEERPNEVEGEGERTAPGFGGFTRITGTERLLERLEESPEHRVAARDYLTARLVDLFLGDWDRHEDQWRWAEVEREGVSYWLPIPRDRDYAFVNYDGWFMRVGRNFVPNGVAFGPDIENIYGLTLNAQALDRRLLAELELAEWDSVAAFVRQRLTDAAIDDAVAALPEPYRSRRGAELARLLKARRDDIPAAARNFYRQMAGEVDVRGTDEPDLALVERQADDVVEVRLFPLGDDGGPGGAAYFQRRFYAPETNEVRIYLHGDDDRAVVRGDVGETLMVRVIGGGGDDVLADSSVVRTDRHETTFYDDRGDNIFVRADQTVVDTRPYEEPDTGHALSGQKQRDWGSSTSLQPYVNYQETDGLIVGGGWTYTRQGFRRVPFAHQLGARARVGLGSFNVAAEVFGVFHRTNSPVSYSFSALATQLENFRFYGFGNQSQRLVDKRLYKVEQDQIALTTAVGLPLPAGGRLEVGPVLKYTNPDVPDGSPLGTLPRYGNQGFGQAGGQAEARFDWRDGRAYPRRGARLQALASAYPGVWSADGAFGNLRVEASGYLTPAAALPVTLALRAGTERAWGEFPVHESAFLGGSRSLRGYDYQRFAGDASVFGNAEVRAPLFRANLLLLRGQLGGLLLADAGRVYFDGESRGGWHTAYGGGLWFRFDLRDIEYLLSATLAEGEDRKIYLRLGAPF